MRRRTRLGVDVDGVLAEMPSRFLWWLVRLGRSAAPAKATLPHLYRALVSFSLSAFRPWVRVVEGAVEAVNSLAKNYVIVVVSARKQSLEQATASWLDENGFHYDEVHCAESLTDKSAYNLGILIDDDLRTARNFARGPRASGRRLTILFDRPWNQRTDPESEQLLKSGKIIRRRSWPEIASDLLSSP